VKLMEKEEIVQVREDRATVRFRFPEAPRSGREVARLEGIYKAYGDRAIYSDLSAQILRGDRIGVVGLNGAGKTTLLRLLASEMPPDRGTVTLGHNVVVGYFAQHHAELLDPSRTVLQEVHSLVPTEPQSWVRGVLGSFLFSGDDVDKKIGVLSGGERARVSLARLLVVPSNFLLMDEPTNHLDLDSSEALIDALTRYEGTLLFVSHNRSFVNGLATQIWEVREGRGGAGAPSDGRSPKGGAWVDAQPGDLDDWSARRKAVDAPAVVVTDKTTPGGQGAQARRERALLREQREKSLGPIKKQVADLEKRIALLEQEKKVAETQLADPLVFADAARSTPLVTQYREASQKLEELYARWEHQQEELSAAEAALNETR
jgi:ATP-binding cassette subfamily F protein 3